VISELKLRASYGLNGQQDGIQGDLYYLDRLLSPFWKSKLAIFDGSPH
jgi:iron complex outermembrane receptor protein